MIHIGLFVYGMGTFSLNAEIVELSAFPINTPTSKLPDCKMALYTTSLLAACSSIAFVDL
jgi:hypothetical protein